MRWPAAQLASSNRADGADIAANVASVPTRRRSPRLVLFAAAELVLAMAIPFILIEGYHTLLESRSGTFVDEPTPADPGWTAAVSTTPILGVTEVVDGGVSGLALVIPSGTTQASGDDATGGTVILIPGNLAVPTPDGPVRLAELDPAPALRTLAQSVRVSLSSAEILTAKAWPHVLVDDVYNLENPDPVSRNPDGGQALAFAVGEVEVGGSNAAVFLGRPVDGASLSSLMFRRQLFWEAAVAQPPSGTHPLATALQETFGASGGRVVSIPTESGPNGPLLDVEATEALIRTVVAFPSGERLKMRLVDRSGAANLEAVAAAVAGRGIEVVEISNALQFDGGATELIVPAELAVGSDQLGELADELGIDPLVDHELGAAEATLLIGSDFAGLGDG